MRRSASLLLLLVFVTHSAGQTADEKKATIAYLQKLESKNGAFLPGPKAAAPTLRATSSCVRTLRHFGSDPSNPAGARAFVLSCLDEKTGAFADTPGGKPDVATTAIGLIALTELKVPTEPYEKRAIAYFARNAQQFEQVRIAAAGLEAIGKKSPKNNDWLARLAMHQNADGTFGQGKGVARETGSAVACLLRLGGKVAKPDAVLKALDAGQRDDGGFGREDAPGSDLDTSYRVVRTYVMMKALPKRADDLKTFIAKCRHADGGYGVTPGAESTVSGTYYAGILFHWLGAGK